MNRIAATLTVVALLLAPTAAQDGNSAWLAWARANHHPIATIHPSEGDTFDDLQFFNAVLKGSPLLLMDFLHHQRVDGNSWMFQSTVQREWGVNPFAMVPRNQYDGVLFIDSVKAPSYLSFQSPAFRPRSFLT